MHKFGLLALPLLLAACPTKTDPRFCENATDCDSQPIATFCDIAGIYGGATETCIAPPANGCNRVETCSDGQHCSDGTDSGNAAEGDGNPGVCVECVDSTHCDTGFVCNTTNNTCEALPCTVDATGDAICAAAAPTRPFCVAADTCGECRPSESDCGEATSPICDAASYDCRGCAINSECGSGLCEDAGSCADANDLLYVDGTDGDDTDDCSIGAKCKTIGAALAKVNAEKKTIVISSGSYDEQLVLDRDVALIGLGDVVISPSLLGGGSTSVNVNGNATVSFDNVDILAKDGSSFALVCERSGGNSPTLSFANGNISGATEVGLKADNCSLTMTQATVHDNGTVGVESSSGSLTMTQSTVRNNPSGGVNVNGSDYSIVNNFFINNGNNNSSTSGVRAQGTSANSEELAFNTFSGNLRNGQEGHALVCDASNLSASSNIFMLTDGNTQGLVRDCTTGFSLFDSDASDTVAGNNISAEADFVNPAQNDYRLNPGSPGIDGGDPASTIDIDFEGDPRDGADAPDIGADETN